MGATTIRPEAPPPPAAPRFSVGERVLHWVNATLFLVLLFTAAALYAGPVSALVGRRDLVKWIHVIAGLCLPVPLLIAALRSPAFRADAGRLNRWTSEDWKWLRRRPSRVGKFNAGQKANAAFIAGAVPVMLATGSIMKWFHPFALSWRTGATFVHDLIAIALLIVIVGHIVKALTEPGKLSAMLRNRTNVR
ncbi:MAG TPA: cytochrome b/b6 domain-containing protein [Acidimicrobiales bacterium]|nr:cytochrome b/b6 domain-containing protein [Acidimicrobiales bacterium]